MLAPKPRKTTSNPALHQFRKFPHNPFAFGNTANLIQLSLIRKGNQPAPVTRLGSETSSGLLPRFMLEGTMQIASRNLSEVNNQLKSTYGIRRVGACQKTNRRF